MTPETDRPTLRQSIAWNRTTRPASREVLAAMIRAGGETFAVLEPEAVR